MFCPRCCCAEKKVDRMWKDATGKLMKEIDILEILKNMRVLKMNAAVQTSRKQRELVKFFQEYTIGSGGDPMKKADLHDSSSGEEDLAPKKTERIVKRNERTGALLSIVIPNGRDLHNTTSDDQIKHQFQ